MIKKLINQINHYKRGRKFHGDAQEQLFYNFGKDYLTNDKYNSTQLKQSLELNKLPSRTDIINLIMSKKNFDETVYLEIGVRNPDDNFNKIETAKKYSVDPGLEFEANPVDFQMTSDEFFLQLNSGVLLDKNIKFDVIFIDGLHLAEQVDKDIKNSLEYLKEDGFIVLHDCNPPTEWHAREDFLCNLTPAGVNWNGTVWKAFVKWRTEEKVSMCCVDTDWGVGIISRKQKIGEHLEQVNEFYEYQWFSDNRKKLLNLVSFDEFKKFFN